MDSNCAPLELRLNASALSDPNALMPPVSIIELNSLCVSALIDSGSTHCFIDTNFVNKNLLSPYSIAPLSLRLLDGSARSVITQATDLSIRFPSGDVTSATFYVTSLDSSCPLVLGYTWLTRYNPLIDWVLGLISFRSNEQRMPTPQAPSSDVSTIVTPSTPDNPLSPLTDSPTPSPHISLVNAAAFLRICQLEDSEPLTLRLAPQSTQLQSAYIRTTPPPDLPNVPKDYHDFADIFSKS